MGDRPGKRLRKGANVSSEGFVHPPLSWSRRVIEAAESVSRQKGLGFWGVKSPRQRAVSVVWCLR